MQTACDLIQKISTSLRTFSRTDPSHKVDTNIHEGLESTLLILKYRLKANEYRPAIEVVKHYNELPLFNGFPSQLKQVFMNILANAIDAFNEAARQTSYEKLETKSQTITIQTDYLRNQNVIQIQDNSAGIPPDIKPQIFDYLFTTKETGKGTGLGLAIAYQIVVNTHTGSLEVQSSIGKEANSHIRLPL